MASLNHTHTYRRIGTSTRFLCSDPHCSHYTEKKLLTNKASLCNECGREFILTREKLRRAVPKCDNCANTKEAIAFRGRKKFIEEIGIL